MAKIDVSIPVVGPKSPSRRPVEKAIIESKNAKVKIAKPVAKPMVAKNRAIVKH